MNSRRMDLTLLGGLGLTQDALDFMQTTYRHGFTASAKAYGSKIIVAGVEDQGATVTDGYVVIDGELMPFVGGAKAPMVWLEDVSDTELFGDSSQKTVYYTRRARMGVIGVAELTDFRRWKTDRTNLDDSEVVASAKAVKKINDALLSILGFESAIVLSGCSVSDINTGAGTLAISAGTVLIGGGLVAAPAFVGGFPAFLKPDGTYTTVQPSGDYIQFDPHTSQRYADVLRRATTPVGEVKTFKTLTDRFDANGLGRWEMKGFKICDDLQSRVPLGYDRRNNDPNDNAWDAQHTVPGNSAGEKRHVLTVGEMPSHNHGQGFAGDAAAGSQGNHLRDSNTPYPKVTGNTGNNEPHENRQPFRVVVFAERI